MRRRLAVSAFVLASGFAHATVPNPPSNWVLGPQSAPVSFASSCQGDEDVASDKREAVDAAAMAFVRNALDGKTDAAFESMSSQVHSDPDKYRKQVQVIVDAVRNAQFTGVKVDHTYLVDAAGSGHDVFSACAPRTGTDRVFAGTSLGSSQAHVLISMNSRNNGWTFTLWLMHEDGAWRVRYFYFGVSAIAGRSAEDLLKLAREQNAHGHALMAEALYVGADITSNRGTSFALSVRRDLRSDVATFKTDPMVEGKPPFTWTMGAATYKVAKVSIIGIGDQLGLSFDLPVDPWKDDKDAEARNHAFLDAFRAAHPEYSEVFAFLDARADKPDGSGGFSTVYDDKKGYL
jgi:hypothetical protein